MDKSIIFDRRIQQMTRTPNIQSNTNSLILPAVRTVACSGERESFGCKPCTVRNMLNYKGLKALPSQGRAKPRQNAEVGRGFFKNNITGISNTAGIVNGLGGVYSYSFDYDDMYRLVSANGSFKNQYDYTLSMSYSPSGNITNKTLEALTLQAGIDVPVDYEANYNYNSGRPHAIESISGTNADHAFQWDENGNMTLHNDQTAGFNRMLCWDEENRLTAVRDENNLSAYIYDAGGERVWKLTGQVQQMYVDGTGWIDIVDLNNKTLYVSPYLVFNEQGYSKHYYAGAERVSSRIGGGMQDALVDPVNYTVAIFSGQEYPAMADDLLDMLGRSIECTDMPMQYVSIEQQLASIEDSRNHNNTEDNRYIYHSDHLGSSAFLTDANGIPTQHLQYLPFGEPFIEQRSFTEYYTPYTFSAKERDTETGYSYFGARYYNSHISVWLSVDPMSDEYPTISAIMYCAGNPIIFVDPDGRKFDYSKLSKEDKKAIKKEIRQLRFKSKTFRKMYQQMRKSETVYTFIKYEVDISSEYILAKASGYYNDGIIGWGDKNTSTLVQEMFHGYQAMKENSVIYRGSTLTDQEAEAEVATYFIMNEVSSKKENRYLPNGGIKDIIINGDKADIVLMDLFEDYSPSPNRKEAGSKEFDRKYQEFKKSFVENNSDKIFGDKPKNYQGVTTNAKAVGLIKLLEAK